MVLKDVDLGCKHCHKNIKKLLNKIPGESYKYNFEVASNVERMKNWVVGFEFGVEFYEQEKY